MLDTKFFDKTLDEILFIIAELNETVYEQVGGVDAFSFEFNEWVGVVKFNSLEIMNTEEDPRTYNANTDSHEDLKDAIKRLFKEQSKIYSIKL